MFKKTLVPLALILAGLACNLTPTATQVPASDVSTEVAKMLTALPTPSAAIQSTVAPPLASATTAPTATPSLTPTPTASPTSTPPATDPKLTLGQPNWRDPFDNGNNWVLGSDLPAAEIVNGKLQMKIPEPGGGDWWRMAAPKLTNFYIEGTATIGACSGRDRYGLVLRAPDLTQGYLFGFTCDGRYSLRKWDGSDFTALKDWTASPFILAGPNQTNRLGLMADGSRLSMYANGQFLDEVHDDTYGQGRFGLFLASTSTSNLTVDFDELDTWNLP